MKPAPSLLDELREQYEASRVATQGSEIEDFQVPGRDACRAGHDADVAEKSHGGGPPMSAEKHGGRNHPLRLRIRVLGRGANAGRLLRRLLRGFRFHWAAVARSDAAQVLANAVENRFHGSNLQLM